MVVVVVVPLVRPALNSYGREKGRAVRQRYIHGEKGNQNQRGRNAAKIQLTHIRSIDCDMNSFPRREKKKFQ